MTIPQDADGGDLWLMPRCVCPECRSEFPTRLDGDVFVGRCGCGHEWYVTPPKVAAMFVTARQRGEPPPVAEAATDEPVTVSQSLSVAHA